MGNLAIIFIVLSILCMSVAGYNTMDMIVSLDDNKLASVAVLKRTFVYFCMSLLFMLLLVASVYASFVLGVCI